MRVALAFQRPDVDQFLDEIDHEQYAEWLAFFALEPHGWQATKIAATRLSYVMAQVNSAKRLRERDHEIKTAAENVQSHAVDHARWEAMAIRQDIVADRG